jgi:phage shock protein PspC (stress-responsive transcriptional regulator)
MSPTERRSLRCSRTNRIFAGVCGGLAEFFGISAFWFRLAFLIALLPGGVPGFLLYLILWIIIPNE